MKKISLFVISLAPVFVLAADTFPVAGGAMENALKKFVEVIINPIIMLLFAAALLYFFWGLFGLIMAISNGEDGSEGKTHMLWGIIGMVIMFSVGGIIGLIANTIGA